MPCVEGILNESVGNHRLASRAPTRRPLLSRPSPVSNRSVGTGAEWSLCPGAKAKPIIRSPQPLELPSEAAVVGEHLVGQIIGKRLVPEIASRTLQNQAPSGDVP